MCDLTNPSPEVRSAPEGDDLLEFRLTYDGELKSASKSKGRVLHKHAIRRVFHKQLRALWETHPTMARINRENVWMTESDDTVFAPYLAQARDGFRWAPLVMCVHEMLCELDVLILRRGVPGNFLAQGDIDGKVKTILDALQRPERGVLPDEEIEPDEGETPFYCLLEDDKLVSKLTVETDSLLGPISINGVEIAENKNDARVIVRVTTKTPSRSPFNLS